MELQLINQELSEAKLYRVTRNFGSLTGRNIADLLYLDTLGTYLLSQTASKPFALDYAKKTTQYGPYSVFRTFATDLYMLAYQVSQPDNDHSNLKDEIASKKFLNSLQFDNRHHWRFVNEISRGKQVEKQAASYFYRLESQLKITDGRYKAWRREAIRAASLSTEKLKQLTTNISREIKRITVSGNGSEMVQALTAKPVDIKKALRRAPNDASSPIRKTAGALAGAAAGAFVANKLNKNKKAGAGLGAIAGYWAAGRKK